MGRPRSKPAIASDLSLQFPLGIECTVKMEFSGEVTQGAIDHLIKHLGVVRESLLSDEVYGRRKDDDVPVQEDAAVAVA